MVVIELSSSTAALGSRSVLARLLASGVVLFVAALGGIACDEVGGAPGGDAAGGEGDGEGEDDFGVGLQIAIEPAAPQDDDALVAVVVAEPAGDPESGWTYTYSWTVNDELRGDLASDTVAAEHTALGDVWTVTATPAGEDGAPGAPASATAALPAVEDRDLDGHSPPGDCDDDDPDVFPGQTAYFAVPRSSGSFDYDCDGVESVEVDWYVECPETCVGYEDPLQAGWSRPSNGVPACGEWGFWGSICQGRDIWFDGQIIGRSCDPEESPHAPSSAQGCR